MHKIVLTPEEEETLSHLGVKRSKRRHRRDRDNRFSWPSEMRHNGGNFRKSARRRVRQFG